MHPFDTCKFKVYYSDSKVDAKYEFNKRIEMKALSRASRDLIALAIRCFSAHTYFINSKIISNLTTAKEMAKNNAFVNTTVSSVLTELDFVKRELYNQINYAKELEVAKQKKVKQLEDIEEEMKVTIESY